MYDGAARSIGIVKPAGGVGTPSSPPGSQAHTIATDAEVVVLSSLGHLLVVPHRVDDGLLIVIILKKMVILFVILSIFRR